MHIYGRHDVREQFALQRFRERFEENVFCQRESAAQYHDFRIDCDARGRRRIADTRGRILDNSSTSGIALIGQADHVIQRELAMGNLQQRRQMVLVDKRIETSAVAACTNTAERIHRFRPEIPSLRGVFPLA